MMDKKQLPKIAVYATTDKNGNECYDLDIDGVIIENVDRIHIHGDMGKPMLVQVSFYAMYKDFAQDKPQ